MRTHVPLERLVRVLVTAQRCEIGGRNQRHGRIAGPAIKQNPSGRETACDCEENEKQEEAEHTEETYRVRSPREEHSRSLKMR